MNLKFRQAYLQTLSDALEVAEIDRSLNLKAQVSADLTIFSNKLSLLKKDLNSQIVDKQNKLKEKQMKKQEMA